MADLKAATITGAETNSPTPSSGRWMGASRATCSRPGDDGYDGARSLWNALHDRRPALIVRCAGTSRRGHGHQLRPNAPHPRGRARRRPQRLGQRGMRRRADARHVADEGHSSDAASRTARAEPGVTWGEFDRETQAFGLATTGGICSEAGIAGVTLGGGFGWLMRKHGLALDNLLSVDIVSADGQLRRASATENLTSSSGSEGRTRTWASSPRWSTRLHPVGPTVLAGMVLHPLQKAGEVLAFYPGVQQPISRRDERLGSPADDARRTANGRDSGLLYRPR